ncbi:MAG: SDR family oxidoreductase [Flavobacteriales bacterium]|nr:SDR family oxidoreductase [Flavobacteriales bacterium]
MNYSKAFHTGSLADYTFLVTGAAGFIGSHLVEYLLQHKAGKVIGIDNLSNGYEKNIAAFLCSENFEFHKADITDFSVCLSFCKQVNFVLHQAALGSVPRSIANPLDTHASNSTGFLNLLEATRISGIKRMVYASSSSVYGNNTDLPKVEHKIGLPLSPYAVSKITNELYAHTYAQMHNMPVIGLRYFNIFGPRQNTKGPYAAAIPLFIESLLNNQPCYINGDGEQSRDFTFIENAVQANIKALFTNKTEAFGKVVNIACGQKISVNQIYHKISNALQLKKEPIYREERIGDVRNSLADISKAKEWLNYTPEVLFEKGVQQTVEWFLENRK